MRRSKWITAAVTLLLALGAVDAYAQEGARSASELQAERLLRRNVLTLGLSAGGAAFSDFQRAQAVTREEVFDRRISAQTSVAFSATATYWISRYWGIRAHGSYAPTRFVLRTPTEEMGEEQALYSSLRVYMLDGDVVFRAPIVLGRVAPYGLVGAGTVIYRADPGTDDPLPAEVVQTFDGDRQRRFAGVMGVGAVIPLDRHSFHLTFELTNHVTRSPVEAPQGGSREEGVLIDPDGWGGDDDGAGLTSHVRLMIGVSLPIAF
jgi:hypothetical protein